MDPHFGSDRGTTEDDIVPVDDVEAAHHRSPARAADVEPAHHRSPARAADDGGVDYMARAQWLRAAVLGAHYGLVAVASVMVGASGVTTGSATVLALGLAGLVGGACTMAIGEFVSVYAQYDIELSQISKQRDGPAKEKLPSPTRAALASALGFTLGALVPLLAGVLVRPLGARVFAAATVGLAGFGATGGYLGGASMARSGFRLLTGGWLAMVVTYGVVRIFAKVFAINVTSLA